MKVVFFGTADFGLQSLRAIAASQRHSLLGVVTGPDKPQGRGLSHSPTPIGRWAEGHGVTPLLKPESRNDADLHRALRSLEADVFVVVAYRILPEAVYSIPRFAFNLHASLLPAYRGAAPIQRAIMAGETRTGVTTFLLKKGVDTGDIIAQTEVPIGSTESFGDLYDRLSEVGSALVMGTLDLLESGSLHPVPQNPALASPAPKLGVGDFVLHFARPSQILVNQVRALAPRPGALTALRDGAVKIFALEAVSDASLGSEPGEIIALDRARGPVVATGDGAVVVLSVQPAGKKIQSGAEFLRGYRVQIGERFTA